MAHAVGLDDIKCAVALAIGFDLRQLDPYIHQRRQAVRAVSLHIVGPKACEQGRDATALEQVSIRSRVAWNSVPGPRNAEIGSITTTSGLKLSRSRCMRARCISNP